MKVFVEQEKSKKRKSLKAGFGIVEVLISAAVLGFLYMALNQLQVSNDENVYNLRCRGGAVEVAQEILDSLKSAGSAAIPSKADADTTVQLDERSRSWERGLGGTIKVSYFPEMVVEKTNDNMVAESESDYTTIQHVYAKRIHLKVSWKFKSTVQSINIPGEVIR